MKPALRKVVVPGVSRLPAFSHAVVAGDQVYLSGVLGTKPGSTDLAEGGTGPQTAQALASIREILEACGCTFADVAKVNVYLTDMTTFDEMNQAYERVLGSEAPARITVGCAGLALDAAVEIDCVAFVPHY